MNLEGKSKRDIAQQVAGKNLKQAGYNGSVIAGTGFGKTRVLVNAAIEKVNNGQNRVLVLVPFDHLKDRFKTEFINVLGRTFGVYFWNTNVQTECYASIEKLDPTDYCMILGDEIHLGLTDRCMEFYRRAERLKIPMTFCTATLPEDPEYRKRLLNIAPPVYEITIDECVVQGFVAPYSIQCIGIDLTDEEAKKYKTVNANFGYWKGKLGLDAFRFANIIIGNKKAYNKNMIEAALGFYRAIRQRKKIIDHAMNKVFMAKEVVNALPGKKLVFGGDNEFTDLLHSSIDGSGVYHSKVPKKQRDAALDDFRTGRINVLCSTKALNQGLDIPDASVGVICGLTSKSLTMIQRVGRLVRRDPADPDKTGNVVIVYVKDSQEEKWLHNSLKDIDASNVVWIDANEYLVEENNDPVLFQDTIDGPHENQI
jgi:superfamily II DNA or RNA helicase